jgi:hypothetical protein
LPFLSNWPEICPHQEIIRISEAKYEIKCEKYERKPKLSLAGTSLMKVHCSKTCGVHGGE